MAYPKYPETKEEWWRMVDENWTDLFNIMWRFLPMDSYEDLEGNLTDKSLSEEIIKLKESQNSKLASYFQATWSAAPDNPSIFEIPKWLLLCDLCSENYVLYEDEIKEKGYG